MTDTLRLALIQCDLVWENPKENRALLTKKIESINENVDLIVLPEMFTTGFTMHVNAVAESMDGDTIKWLKKLALIKNCAITGSFIVYENRKYYNRLVFIKPDNQYFTYDKHHLFTLAKEHTIFTAGQDQIIISYKGWNIKPQICYDLRFPLWSRNTSNYDILLYVASWPKLRITAWDALLKARAIENMSYCIGVNRVGIDKNGFEYNGHSTVYDALGNSIIENYPIENETIIYTILHKTHLKNTRQKFSFLTDRDNFKIIN